jgi:dihydroorotate dehydrogenase (NAD+) catalytic subunit
MSTAPRSLHSAPALPASVAVDFCGLKLASPIVLLSGCVGFGEEYTRVEGFSNTDVGAIVLKGTTLEPRLGNPPHRVYETPMGMLNAIGLQNPGVAHVVERILPTLDLSETRFFANVCGSTIDDYVEVTRRFEDSPIDAIEINISCPNIKEGGIQFGCNLASTGEVVAAVRHATTLPLIPKLTPNVTSVSSFARAAEENGADAVSLVNTFLAMVIDPETRRPAISNGMGGLSGPAIRPIAVRMVYECAKQVRIPVIGMGGISSARDVLEFMIAGATAVQVGTANFVDPFIWPTLRAGIEDYMTRHGVARVADLVGTVDF